MVLIVLKLRIRAIETGVVPLRRITRATMYAGGRIIALAWPILSAEWATSWLMGEYCLNEGYADVAILLSGTREVCYKYEGVSKS